LSNQGELSRRIADAMESADYQVEDVILSLTGEFLERLELTGTTRTELASRLGVKPPRVTRILQGNDNFTLRTVVHMADALGCKLVFALAPCGAETRWTHYFNGGSGEAKTARVPAPTARIRDYSTSPLPSDTTPIWLEAKAG